MSSTRGIWTEMLAFYLLESLGYQIVSYRQRVERGGVEVAEIDALARKNDVLYAVEVKSGRISTTDIRQAFSNAQLIGAKPLLVARGFSDKSAEVYARELGVEVILLPDYFHFVSMDELMQTLEEAMFNSLAKLLGGNFEELKEKELELLRVLASSSDVDDTCRKLGISFEEFSRMLGELRDRGILLESGSFERLKVQARIVLILRKILLE
ncbi:MAG: endonuclease [Infirmifilum sp.]